MIALIDSTFSEPDLDVGKHVADGKPSSPTYRKQHSTTLQTNSYFEKPQTNIRYFKIQTKYLAATWAPMHQKTLLYLHCMSLPASTMCDTHAVSETA